jgi:D-erythronate 2-dehydrogenase
MKIVITGGAGFLGRRLAQKLLEIGRLQGPDGRDETLDEIVLLDVVPAQGFTDSRIRAVAGDITDAEVLRSVIDSEVRSVFHLAPVVSGQAEADFDASLERTFAVSFETQSRLRTWPGYSGC